MSTYSEKREELIALNDLKGLDPTVPFSPEEETVNLKIKLLKEELLSSYEQDYFFPFDTTFLIEKKRITETRLYDLIEKMPKGALLHVHSASLLTTDCLIKELTTLPNCYVYLADDGRELKGTFRFYAKHQAPEGFQEVAILRGKIPNFDEVLTSILSIKQEKATRSGLWVDFENWYKRTSGLIHYKPAFIKYYTLAFESLLRDNLQYMELRSLNTPVYNLDGSVESTIATVELFSEIKKEFRKKHPGFNFNLIYTDFRNTPKKKAFELLELAYRLRSLYPDFIIGYDLVGEEDLGRTAFEYAETFIKGKEFESIYGVDMPYYLHNGESLLLTNTNMYDAVLLGSKRIGHGLTLFRYPYLIEKIKEEKLCIEVCPISNLALDYVSDLRTHPALGYLKQGVPCVIASDDPGLFGYHGLSPDIWLAVTAWDLDLRMLKQLFANSITYSGMKPEEKIEAFTFWENEWNGFIQKTLERR